MNVPAAHPSVTIANFRLRFWKLCFAKPAFFGGRVSTIATLSGNGSVRRWTDLAAVVIAIGALAMAAVVAFELRALSTKFEQTVRPNATLHSVSAAQL